MCYWTVDFQMVNFMFCEFHLNKKQRKKHLTSFKVKHISFFIIKFGKRELLFLAWYYINRPIILKALWKFFELQNNNTWQISVH